jgi:hypothetical protein
MPMLEMRSFAECKALVDGVASKKMKAEDLPDSELVNTVYEIEFDLARERLKDNKNKPI